MTYQPEWRAQDELRVLWLEFCYQLDGRNHYCHPDHGLFTGLVDKYGQHPQPKVN